MKRTVKPNQSMSYALLSAVAEVKDCCPTDLPPLHETVDVDALDVLFSAKTDKAPQFEGSFMFKYSDCYVSIWSDRLLTLSISSQHGGRIETGSPQAQ